MEFRRAAVGDLFLWAGAVPQDPPGGRSQARGEGVPDGGTRGLSTAGLYHHEGGQ